MGRDRRFAKLIVKLFVVVALAVPLGMGCAAQSPVLAKDEGLPARDDGQLDLMTLASIEATEGEQGTQIIIKASKPFSYTLANHDKPPHVLIEIPGAQLPLSKQHVPLMRVNKGVVQTIALEERTDRARVEIALEELVNYEIHKEADRLVLSFKNPMASGERRAEPDRLSTPATAARPVELRERLNTPLQSPERLASLPQVPAAGAAVSELPNPLEQVIGGMDVLEILVHQEEDLSGLYRVSANGDIPFPLVGDIHVAGLTPPQAQQKLEALLGEGYLKRPQVIVTVKEYRSKGVSVLGAVQKPGAYQLVGGRTTLLEVLSMAEGVNLDEGSKSLILVRTDERGETRSMTIDVDRLLKEGDTSLNMILQPNDAIYVAKAETIALYGEVQRPGTYPLESREMAVLEALSKAGGLTKFAAPNRSRIIRVVDGKEKSIQVRVGDIIKGEQTRDVMLQPGDILVVPESYF